MTHRSTAQKPPHLFFYERKINHSEHPLAFIEHLRATTIGNISSEEAVNAYYGRLQDPKIPKDDSGCRRLFHERKPLIGN